MTLAELIEEKKKSERLLKELKSIEKKKKMLCFEVDSKTVVCVSDEKDIEEYKKIYKIKES